jgi:hypothetical protein
MAKQQQHYFRFTPQDQSPGFNSLVGDVTPGVIYPVRDELAERFVDHPQWEPASQSEYDAQQS